MPVNKNTSFAKYIVLVIHDDDECALILNVLVY